MYIFTLLCIAGNSVELYYAQLTSRCTKENSKQNKRMRKLYATRVSGTENNIFLHWGKNMKLNMATHCAKKK